VKNFAELYVLLTVYFVLSLLNWGDDAANVSQGQM
jgi:hypothetical protein